MTSGIIGSSPFDDLALDERPRVPVTVQRLAFQERVPLPTAKGATLPGFAAAAKGDPCLLLSDRKGETSLPARRPS
jgi:hypothetical protein